MHLGDSDGRRADDVGESSNDLRERTLTDNDQRAIDDRDGLGRCLQRLRFLSKRADVVDHLAGRECSKCTAGAGSCEDDVAERNHSDSEGREDWLEEDSSVK